MKREEVSRKAYEILTLLDIWTQNFTSQNATMYSLTRKPLKQRQICTFVNTAMFTQKRTGATTEV